MYQVLACGSNGNYQLGQDDDEDQRALRLCIFQTEANKSTTTIDQKPTKIACGGNHTLLLFENGDVFSCGDNEFGQTGHPKSTTAVRVFSKVPPMSPHKYLDVSCGWDYSFLLTDQNELFACGNGLKGDLGLGEDVTQASRPQLVIKFDSKVKKIKTAVNHTIVQTEDNKLYGWGNCRRGQLGTIDSNLTKRGAVWRPIELDFGITDIESFELGREFTIIMSSNVIHLFGKATINLLDLNDIMYSSKLVEAMWSSIHCKSGTTIKSFGTNTHGQLYDYGPISDDFEFVVGSEHGLLKVADKVYAWGWGEHGNCGDAKHNNSATSVEHNDCNSNRHITFDYLNVLYEESDEVTMVAGGCATSWVITHVK